MAYTRYQTDEERKEAKKTQRRESRNRVMEDPKKRAEYNAYLREWRKKKKLEKLAAISQEEVK